MPNEILLTDTEIRRAHSKAMEQAQEYGDDGNPIPERAIAKAQLAKSSAYYEKKIAGLEARIKDGEKSAKWNSAYYVKEISNLEEACADERAKTLKEAKIAILEAIVDEPEFPDEMPEEMWQQINGNKELATIAMRNTVRLTKNGITERLLPKLKDMEALKSGTMPK